MSHYVPLEIVKFPRKPTAEASQSRHWKGYKNAYLRQDHSSITNIAVSLQFYAVTSSARVRFFTYKNQNKFSLTRFRNTAIGGSFRSDGELFSAGDIEGSVNIFQVSSKTLLRSYRHPKPSYAAQFVDKTHLLTGCDDFCVRYWDLTQKKEIRRFEGHGDYVRSVGSWENCLISAGMDGKIKFWDPRAGFVQEFDHGASVSSLLLTDSCIITSGHVSYKLWDIRSCKDLACLTPHSKLITSTALNSHKSKLFTGSADCHLKIHDLTTFNVEFTVKYPEPILAVQVSPTDSHLIVGMADGKLSVRQNKSKRIEPATIDATDAIYLKKWEEYYKSLPEETVKNYRYFNRGVYSRPEENELAADNENKKKIKDYDILLRKFRYGEVLDLAFEADRPEMTISIVQELVLRNGLKDALMAREPAAIVRVISWLAKKIHNPKYSATVLPLSCMVVDMYSALSNVSPELASALKKLLKEVEDEYSQQTQACEVIGIIDFILLE